MGKKKNSNGDKVKETNNSKNQIDDEDEKKEIKVEKWDINSVKNGFDDSLRKYMEELGWKENHFYLDIRLGFSLISVIVAGFALAYDQLYPYPQSSLILTVCPLTYLLLMAMMTYYLLYIDKGTVFYGKEKDTTIRLQSKVKKFVPIYNLTLTFKKGSTGDFSEKKELKIENFIDVDGVVVQEVFRSHIEQFLTSAQTQMKKS
ncbi:hypothetical protein SNEBB_000547 [Seison nebaliae]|nr:hypothetical protein SNEBB_000547 [Seison nebaliae]